MAADDLASPRWRDRPAGPGKARHLLQDRFDGAFALGPVPVELAAQTGNLAPQEGDLRDGLPAELAGGHGQSFLLGSFFRYGGSGLPSKRGIEGGLGISRGVTSSRMSASRLSASGVW